MQKTGNGETAIKGTVTEMEIEVTVIIPFFQSEARIDRCLNSIMAQDFQPMEILFVDDGSTDGTAEHIRRAAASDSRIRYLSKTHGGQGAARNCGIEQARGRYLFFMDSDDEIDPQTVSALWESAQQTDADVVIMGFWENRADGRICRMMPRFFGSREQFMTQLLKECYQQYLLNAPWNKLIRRELLAQSGIRFEEDMCVYEDLLFSLQVLCQADTIAGLEKAYYSYHYMQEGSVLSQYHPETDRDLLQMAAFLEKILAQYPLDRGYFYGMIVKQMMTFSSRMWKNADLHWLQKVFKQCRIMTEGRMGFYLWRSRATEPKLRRQLCQSRLLYWPMRLTAALTGRWCRC